MQFRHTGKSDQNSNINIRGGKWIDELQKKIPVKASLLEGRNIYSYYELYLGGITCCCFITARKKP